MGVHDFSDALYSRKNEGEQNLLIIDRDCYKHTPEESITKGWSPYDSEEVYEDEILEFKSKMSSKKIPNPVDVLTSFDYFDTLRTSSPSKAVVEIVVFEKDMKITKKNFKKEVRNETYVNRYFKKYNYSWDDWDFTNKDDGNDILNYMWSTEQEMPIFWKVKDIDSKKYKKGIYNSVYDEHKQVWVRNYSNHAYRYYIKATKLNAYLSNLDIAYVAYQLNIDYRDKTRVEVFKAIKKRIRKWYNVQ